MGELLPDTVTRLRELLAADELGDLTVEMDSCDCGGGMPCGHPDYPYALVAVNVSDPYEHAAMFETISIESAALIAGARNVLPALLDRLEELEARDKACRDLLRRTTLTTTLGWPALQDDIKRELTKGERP